MVKQLDELILKARPILKKDLYLFSDDESEAAEILANRLETAVVRLTPKDSVYAQQIQRAKGSDTENRLRHNLQVTISLRDDLKDGWTETVVELVHADTYSDYLEMADALLAKGYKDAAAVITGTSLEVHVRALCVKNGVTTAVAGKPKPASTMNDALKKADVYDGLQHKKVMAWMDLRNKAAHGDYATYDKDEVRQFIDGVQAFMMKYPA